VLRRSLVSLTALVLLPTAALAGAATAAEEDSYYPGKGDPGVEVAAYALDLTWRPAERRLSGSATLQLRATATAASFQLDLSGRMDVRQVTVDGLAAGFEHTGKTLTVRTPVLAGTSYDVKVAYAGRPTTVAAPTRNPDYAGLGWHTTKDGRVWTMQKPFGAYTWHPVNDHPSDKARYTIRLDVPGKWVGVAGGRMLSRAQVGKRTVTEFESGDPVASHLVTVAIGPYQRFTQEGPHGLPLTYWLPKGHKELLGPLRKTPDALRWLERRLGPYPFSRAGVVVTPGRGSVGSQTLVTLAKDNYRYGDQDVRRQLVHDLVHAWYGASVTPADWRDVWMSESMATYLTAKFAAHSGWQSWWSSKRAFTRNDSYWRELYGPPGAYHRRAFDQRNVRYGGALLLERLRGKIGTADFNTAVREWPQQHAHRSRGRASYVAFVEQQSGQSLGPWFQDWLMSEDTPR
jgi:aminopeptidase N